MWEAGTNSLSGDGGNPSSLRLAWEGDPKLALFHDGLMFVMFLTIWFSAHEPMLMMAILTEILKGKMTKCSTGFSQ